MEAREKDGIFREGKEKSLELELGGKMFYRVILGYHEEVAVIGNHKTWIMGKTALLAFAIILLMSFLLSVTFSAGAASSSRASSGASSTATKRAEGRSTAQGKSLRIQGLREAPDGSQPDSSDPARSAGSLGGKGKRGFSGTVPEGKGSMLPPPGPGLGGPLQRDLLMHPPASRRSKLDGRAAPGPYSAPDENPSARRSRSAGVGSSVGDTPNVRRRAPVSINFERVIQACLYRDGRWLLPNQPEYQAGQVLGSLSPTFITGAMTVTAGARPDRQTVVNWSGLRRAVRKMAGKSAFDIVLDLRHYPRPEEIVSQMAATASLFEAEAWTLQGLSSASGKRTNVLRAAVVEARRQGRRVGGYLDGGSPSSVDLDYLLVHYEDAIENSAWRAPGMAGEGDAQVILVAGSAKGPPGSGFAMGKTPAERRLMVMRASRSQKDGLAFAYPVFGPMADRDRAYNSLRDEFMLDTVRRGMRAHNAGSSPK